MDERRRRNQLAGLKAAATKGEEERRRAALMANWTRRHGKDDERNPYTKANYYRSKVGRCSSTSPTMKSETRLPGHE
jgi:hypothetical protein